MTKPADEASFREDVSPTPGNLDNAQKPAANDANQSPPATKTGRRRNLKSRKSAPKSDSGEQQSGPGEVASMQNRASHETQPQAEGQGAPEKKPRKSQPAPRKKNLKSKTAQPPLEQDAPEQTAIQPDSIQERTQPAAQAEEIGAKKGRRGKRGGKKKNAGSRVSSQIPTAASDPNCTVVAMLVAEAVCRFPALPVGQAAAQPSGKSARSRKKASPQENRPVPVKRMYISVIPGEQVEVGLTEDGTLLEYYLDMLRHRKLKGNIYRGVIHNIDPNLQAAFVDFGVGKNGFLQIDEVHPEYWQGYVAEPGEKKKFPPIQKVLHPGQELLVQVVKEASGNKGAFLTTWISLAGRFLVLTPGQEQVGISRKVTDAEERSRLREMMTGLSPGADLGVIVRTVGEGATKTTLKNDLQYLKRLWRDIRKKATKVSAPALVHLEPGLSQRAVRDYLTDEVTEIWVDNAEEAETVRDMANLLFPRKKNLVHVYDNPGQSIWDYFHLRGQLEQIYAREVPLPSGGRLVFDQTEALMAIDINSGKISGKGNFEAMAFKTNIEAAQTIAQQLRLRDVGGQVVIDFIEMREKKHVQEVEKTLRQAMKTDRARHDVAGISSFGLLELVRQRMGSSALSLSTEPCAACGGTGMRRNMEWQALQSLQELASKLRRASGEKFSCEYPRELGLYLLNHKREALRNLENSFNKSLEIKIQP